MKTLLAALLAVTTMTAAHASPQTEAAIESVKEDAAAPLKALILGIHVGPNFSTANSGVSNGSVPETQMSTRMSFGVSAALPLHEVISFQPELNYVERGFDTVMNRAVFGSAAGTKLSYNFDYLEVPLLLKARMMSEEKIRPFALAGPSIGYMISKSVVMRDSDGYSATYNGDRGQLQSFNSWEINLNLGAGVEADITPTSSLFASLRYTLGLLNTLSNGEQTTSNGFDSIKNSGVQFLTGIQFTL